MPHFNPDAEATVRVNKLIGAPAPAVNLAADIIAGADEFKTKIKAPYTRSYASTLGGEHRATLMFVISLDPRESWANGILENSHYGKGSLDYTGVLEIFSGHGPLRKFRKTRVKSLDQAAEKLNAWIAKVQAAPSA